MSSPRQKQTREMRQMGFTLMEAIVAMAAGLLVLGAAMMLFQQASSAGRTTMSKTEMEQNGRAALNFMLQDLGMAATDYQQAGVRVPQSGSMMAIFGCSGCNTSTYPNNLATPIVPYDKNSYLGTSDTITVVYVDNTWPPAGQTVATDTTTTPPSAKISSTGDQITVTTASFTDPTGTSRNYQDTMYGSKSGDVMMIWNPNGYALATVTGVANGGVLTLAPGDQLNLNQTTAGAANVAALKSGALYPQSTAATRLKVVTYFVTNTAGPDGVTGTSDDIPVLMRQVNGDPAGAKTVTDYIQNLQVTYDLYNPVSGVWQFAATGFGGPAPTVTDPTQIRKINVALQIRSQAKNSSGTYDTVWVSSSISPRDLSFTDRYK
jgi:hypothetical protein